jgi:chemotaxis methyl-accepting protein methylase
MGCVAASGGGGAGVRCWSLGCSAGEEAYSLALLWEQGVRRRLPDLGRVGFSRSRGP